MKKRIPRSPRDSGPDLYRRVRPASSARQVREGAPTPPGFGYSERHLRCVWFDPAWRPRDLRTHKGEAVTVENPGRWNLEAGPDFLDAALVVGPERRRIRGDVEIHIRPADWTQHGHREDPRYDRVVAHITYLGGALPEQRFPAGAVQIALKEALAADPAFSFDNLDITAYPYAARDRFPPCAEILRAQPVDHRLALLESAGLERFRRRAERLAEAIATGGMDEVFYEEILCALGYKNNKIPFRTLARKVPLAVLREEAGTDVDHAYALLCGVAGLLPEQNSPQWDRETRAQVRRWWDFWWKQRSRWEHAVLPKDSWNLAGLRPPNHPARRLMAAACLFGGLKHLPREVMRLGDLPAGDWNREAVELLESANAETYWSFRYGLSGPRRPRPAALIGAARMAAMVLNVVAPFVAARDGGADPAWPARLQELPPEEDNSQVRQAAHSLFGRDHNPALHRTALRQQGLLQILHDFCLRAETGCAECRLPAALTAAFTES